MSILIASGYRKGEEREGSSGKEQEHVDVRELLRDFAQARSWNQFHTPRNVCMALVGEVGELCECFQWKGDVERGLRGWTKEEVEHLGEELADVFLYLVRLADVCSVDLGRASLQKIEKNAAKYPVALAKGRSDKYTTYSAKTRGIKGSGGIATSQRGGTDTTQSAETSFSRLVSKVKGSIFLGIVALNVAACVSILRKGV